MKRLALALAAVALLTALPATAAADEGDAASTAVSSLFIGQQAVVILEIATAPGASVEVDPAAPGWNGVEVVRVASSQVSSAATGDLHRIEVVVAPFQPGQGTFAPGVNVTLDGAVTPRALPAVSWEVVPTLAPDAPLELSALPAPTSIEGAESPLLRPAIVVGVIVVLALATWLAIRGWRWASARRPEPAPHVMAAVAAPGLDDVEEIIDTDPVLAYRSLSSKVRSSISEQYGFPANALTTGELAQRMEGAGVDRWQARLVSGLLQECDKVVYAGYRPAAERRRADVTMAREIVGEAV